MVIRERSCRVAWEPFLADQEKGAVVIPVTAGRRTSGKVRLRLLYLTDWVSLEGLSSGRRRAVNIKFEVMRRRSKTWLRGLKPSVRLFWSS